MKNVNMKHIFISLIIIILNYFNLYSQNFSISFYGYGDSNIVDSVSVINLKSGNSMKISGSNILQLVPGSGLRFLKDSKTNVVVYPNPSDDICNIEFVLDKASLTNISLCDVTGKTLLEWSGYLDKSANVFLLKGLGSGIFYLSIKAESLIYSTKIVGTSYAQSSLQIHKINEYSFDEISIDNTKSEKSDLSMPYNYGDLLLFEGIAPEGYRTVKTLILNQVAQDNQYQYVGFNFVNCKDAENYMYKIVEIGDYVWMAEDLKTTKYRDNTSILKVEDTQDWVQQKEGAWCNYDNKSSEPVLYNWYTTVDSRKVCPLGWHIPTDYEWKKLESIIGLGETAADTIGWRGNDLSWKLKESGTEHWLSNTEEKTNLTGFSAIASGMRNFVGNFYYKNNNAVWWTSTESNEHNAWCRALQYDINSIFREDGQKNMGLSLRCIKNYPPEVTTFAIQDISINSANSGGKITNNGGSEITSAGVIWSTYPHLSYEMNLGKTNNYVGNNEYTSKLTNLNDSTEYFVRAYAVNETGVGYGDIISFKTFSDTITKLVDIDGNEYDVVKIGSYKIIGKNLKTTKLNDGTPINKESDYLAWEMADSELYTWYNDDINNKNIHGALYNWNSVKTGKLCPEHWHVPTDAEWGQIEILLGLEEEEVEYQGNRGEGVGSKLAGFSNLWDAGELVNHVSFGESGVNIVPTGTISSYDGFYGMNEKGTYWSSTMVSEYSAFGREISSFETGVTRYDFNKDFGLAVRCVKGDLIFIPPQVKTHKIINVGANSAEVLLSVYGGNSYVWEKGVIWSTQNVFDIETNDGMMHSFSHGQDTVNVQIYGLTQGTEYFVKAYAKFNDQIVYGEILNFTSLVRGEDISDTDGNLYQTIKFGNDYWTNTNNKTTKYNDNTSIPIISGLWQAKADASYAWYNNDPYSYADVYGALYSWGAVMVEGNGGHNICPIGYHVATVADWNNLIFNWGGYLKAADFLKEGGTVHWTNANTGTNISGFTALPGGLRTETASFKELGEIAAFWAYDPIEPKVVSMYSSGSFVNVDVPNLSQGYSVRCVKNAIEPVVPVFGDAYISEVLMNGFIAAVDIISDGGVFVSKRGVVWSNYPNPSLENYDGISYQGTGSGQFICQVTELNPTTTYYVTAFAVNEKGTSYYDLGSITTDFVNCGTVTDVKGNVYKTVTIGNQCWIRENLKTTAYTDNTPITIINDAGQWSNNFTPAMTWYECNFNQYGNEFGALYNYKVSNLMQTKGKLICPEGFHVPYAHEWQELFDYAQIYGNPAVVLGAQNYWQTITPTNELGFFALPSGIINDVGFNGLNDFAYWQTFPDSEFDFYSRAAILLTQNTQISEDDSNSGVAIRCLKNNDGATIPNIGSIQIQNLTHESSDILLSNIIDGGYEITVLGVIISKNSNLNLENYDAIENVYIAVAQEPYFVQFSNLDEDTEYFYRWFAINALGVAYGDIQTFITNQFMGIFDGDGNSYNSITIGEQKWLSENLKTTHYIDGANIMAGGFSWYNDDYANYGSIYGALYNFDAVNLLTNKGHSLCPVGWHIPTQLEWNNLIFYVGGVGIPLDKLKSVNLWSSNPGTDEFNFRALPAGYKDFSLGFMSLTNDTHFWSSSIDEYNIPYGLYLSVSSGNNNYIDFEEFNNSYSIRCIKNMPYSSVPSLTIDVPNAINEWQVNLTADVTTGNSSYDVIYKGFVYSQMPNVNLETAETVRITDISPYYGQYSFTEEEFIEGNTYYVRAFAINAIGIGYSEEIEYKYIAP